MFCKYAVYFRTVSHKITSRGLLLNIVTNQRREVERFNVIEIVFVRYFTCLFLFHIVLTEKCKKIKTIEDDFYHKVIEAKCSGNFKLKAGYTAEE